VTASATIAAQARPAGRWREALERHDPGLLAGRRAVRAAIVVPAAFALARAIWGGTQPGLFAAFGSFALLLLVQFTGHWPVRLRNYASLWAVGAVLIVVGTLCSQHAAAAVISMALAGFVILFAGIASPAAATAATAAILTYVLPVSVTAPPSAIPARLGGWLLAGVLCIASCLLLWPPPPNDGLRRRVAGTARALGGLVRGAPGVTASRRLAEGATEELRQLREQFEATPYPPTGAGPADSSIWKVLSRLEWVGAEAVGPLGDGPMPGVPGVHDLHRAEADVLDSLAVLVDAQTEVRQQREQAASDLGAAVDDLRAARRTALDRAIASFADTPASGLDELARGASLSSAIDPTLHARILGFATELTAEAALDAVAETGSAAAVRSVPALSELAPTGRRLWAALRAHTTMRSVWLRNSLRGAMGLALAVLVINLADVSHGFWVALGVLSVLRSNALGTGSTALRALAGTILGFVVGAAIMIGLANHTALLWAVLPLAVLLAGYAPAAISFVAGQAAFTVVVVVLFNIIAPVGWSVGLLRIEDVAIGCLIALAVGLLFWPRGATTALGRALAESYAAAADYLARAIERITGEGRPDTRAGRRRAEGASRRLDDSFREYLAERGAKRLPVHTMAGLVTGATRVHLSAYSLATLRGPDPAPPGVGTPVLEAAGVLCRAGRTGARWSHDLEGVLQGRREPVEAPGVPEDLQPALLAAFAAARAAEDGATTRTCLQMLMAYDDLCVQRRLQLELLASFPVFVRARRHWWR
jgi:hypothetical protein